MSDPLARFEVVRELARGGMGVVYLARDPGLGREVAVKRILGDLEEMELQRFKREGEVLARLRHRHVLRVWEAGLDGTGRPYLVIDFVSGGALSQRLRATGRLPWEEVAAIGEKLAGALAHAHGAGVLHRDLKPANVLLDDQGEPVLVDFGLARDAAAQKKLTQTGAVMGTPSYMPPEQAGGDPTDERSDVYGLGATLYALLGGIPPFDGETPMNILTAVLRDEPRPLRELAPEAPADLVAVLERSMAKEPAARYPDMVAFARDLARARQGEPLSWKPRRRRGPSPALIAGGALLLALLGGGAAWALHRARADEQEASAADDDVRDPKGGKPELSRSDRNRLRDLVRDARVPGDPHVRSSTLRGLDAWLRDHAGWAEQHPEEVASARQALKTLRAEVPLRAAHVGASRTHVFWHGDGEVVAASQERPSEGQGQGILVRWPLADEAPQRPVPRGPPCMRAAGDGRFAVLSGGMSNAVTRYDLDVWPPTPRALLGGSARALAFHPTAPLLGVGAEAGWRVLRLASGEPETELRETPHRRPVMALAFSADGALLAIASGRGISESLDDGASKTGGRKPSDPGSRQQEAVGGYLSVVDWRTGQARFQEAPTPMVGSWMAFTRDGQQLVVGCGGGPMGLFDARTGQKLLDYVCLELQEGSALLRAHHGIVQTLALSHDAEETLVYSCGEDALAVWERRTGKLLRRVLAPPPLKPTSAAPRLAFMALSPDGERIAVGTHHGDVLIYAANP